MVKIKSKVAIAVIAVAALLIVASLGAAAYWSVNQIVSGNKLESGHMVISVKDENQATVTPLSISGLVPIAPPPNPDVVGNKKVFTVESATGNPLVDFAFTIPTVTGQGTLKDNVKVAFLLSTAGNNAYWLEPNGAIPFTVGENANVVYSSHAYVMSAYDTKTWTGMPGYTSIAPGPLSMRHVTVYWWLPLDCSNDCHDSDVTFDMSFELLQSH